MITRLSSPSVCVIDEDPKDYKPILDALNGLYVGCVHIHGDDIDELPPEPFSGLRLVFLDLHLTGSGGKDAASHTANVFRRVVSPESAPVLAVIWSKYARDRVEDGTPPDDQETEAELFKRTLFDAEPKYQGRVIFVEMEKLKPGERPVDWTSHLRARIESALNSEPAIDLLWKWDSVVREACVGVSSGLTVLAKVAADESGQSLGDSLKDAMQRLSKAQGESNFSAETATRHLSVVLSQLLVDHLEQLDNTETYAPHGVWLGIEPSGAGHTRLAPHMNGLLLTSSVASTATPFGPGTVYRVRDLQAFQASFGKELSSLVDLSFEGKPEKAAEWRAGVFPVVIEISPECDVAQDKRVSALLLAGLLVPAALERFIKKAEMLCRFPRLHLRQVIEGFSPQAVTLVVCHRYRAVLSLAATHDWLEVWFRLRELPAASLRNAHASQASRVGFVSLGIK